MLPFPQPPPTVCCIVSRPLRTTVTPVHPCMLSVHHFLSATITCTSDLPRLTGDLVRPDTGHPPTSGPDTPRVAQTMTRGPFPIPGHTQRPLSLVWCLAERGKSWGEGMETSHRGHTYTKVTHCLSGITPNWVSCTFPGSPTPECSFVPAFVNHVNPAMRELVAGRPPGVPS